MEREKELAARAAVEGVRTGATVALGTGTTAAYAIHALADRFRPGEVVAVASSRASEELARQLGLRVRALEEGDQFDVMIDGADEVAPDLSLTKGGGGALFREKLLARASRELLIAVDHRKLVPRLGERSPIPVEIVPFARPALLHRLKGAGLAPNLRRSPSGAAYLTDNGNELLDLAPPGGVADPAALDRELRGLHGVVATGLFVGMASAVFVASPDGKVETRRPNAAVAAR